MSAADSDLDVKIENRASEFLNDTIYSGGTGAVSATTMPVSYVQTSQVVLQECDYVFGASRILVYFCPWVPIYRQFFHFLSIYKNMS